MNQEINEPQLHTCDPSASSGQDPSAGSGQDPSTSSGQDPSAPRDASGQTGSGPEHEAPRKSSRRWLWSLIAVALLLAGIVVFFKTTPAGTSLLWNASRGGTFQRRE